MKYLLAVSTLVLGGTTAFAADFGGTAPPMYTMPSSTSFFVEGRLGVALGMIDDLRFHNPNNLGGTTNPVSGNYIILNNINKNHTAIGAYLGAGGFITDNFFARASYRYFGEQKFSGSATFGGTAYNQDLRVQGHGLFLGLGAHVDLSDAIYLEGVVDIGAAFLTSDGRQGANIGAPNAFPQANHTNWALGAEILTGFRVTDNVDLTLSASYHHLGNANTGTTGNPPPAGMNANERLEANLGTTSIMAGVRFKF